MSGRSLGTAMACPCCALYHAPSWMLSALTCLQSSSEGPNTSEIGTHASWQLISATPTRPHAQGTTLDPNRRGAHHSSKAAMSTPTKTYGNAKTRVIGIHHTQLARYDVKPSMPLTKTQ